jgi:hypothetical protein
MDNRRASLCHELFHGGNGFASNAHDFHTVVLIQLVSDGRFGQERPALYQAGNRICELGRHPDRHSRVRRPAIRKIRSRRDRANHNKSGEHASLPRQPTARRHDAYQPHASCLAFGDAVGTNDTQISSRKYLPGLQRRDQGAASQKYDRTSREPYEIRESANAICEPWSRPFRGRHEGQAWTGSCGRYKIVNADRDWDTAISSCGPIVPPCPPANDAFPVRRARIVGPA